MRIYSALILLATLCACGRSVDPATLPGKYEADHGKGVDSIVISSDGSYSYSFVAEDGRKIDNRGRWSAAIEGAKTQVTFEDFIFGLPGYGGSKPAFWVTTAEKCAGSAPCFCLDPDLNYYYRKAASP